MTTTRGFLYDQLTEASDQSITEVRDRIFACPCGYGAWLSLKTGEVYRGNGGNEREQWWLQSIGPWVYVLKDAEFDNLALLVEELRDELGELRHNVADVIGAESK